MRKSTKTMIETAALHPEYVVNYTFSALLVVYGLWNATPLTNYGQVIPSPWGLQVQIAAGIMFVLVGIFGVVACHMKRYDLIIHASLGVFCAYLFAAVIRVAFYGFDVPTWLIFLGIALVVSFCRFAMRVKHTS